jgi:hypothetical protein
LTAALIGQQPAGAEQSGIGRSEYLSWLAFAHGVGVHEGDDTKLVGMYGRLDVVSAEWLAPEGDMDAVVELRVRTRDGHVLNLDMPLLLGCITDATSDYDEVDGELVEHQYDMSKPEDVERLFGFHDDGD